MIFESPILLSQGTSASGPMRETREAKSFPFSGIYLDLFVFVKVQRKACFVSSSGYVESRGAVGMFWSGADTVGLLAEHAWWSAPRPPRESSPMAEQAVKRGGIYAALRQSPMVGENIIFERSKEPGRKVKL